MTCGSGSSRTPVDTREYQDVVLIAGGSGITHCASGRSHRFYCSQHQLILISLQFWLLPLPRWVAQRREGSRSSGLFQMLVRWLSGRRDWLANHIHPHRQFRARLFQSGLLDASTEFFFRRTGCFSSSSSTANQRRRSESCFQFSSSTLEGTPSRAPASYTLAAFCQSHRGVRRSQRWCPTSS